MQRLCFAVDRSEIGYLRFQLESYDGLGFVRTLDAGAGIVEIAWPASRHEDMQALLAALEGELSLREVVPPADYRPL